MKTMLGRALLSVAAVLLAVACGGDDDTADEPDNTVTTPTADETDEDAGDDEEADDTPVESPEPSAACPLLEGVDTAELLGEAAGDPEEGTETCIVEAASADSRGGVSLVASTNSAAANYDNRVELFGIDSEPSGFGDRAFHSGPYLIVLDGETLLQLQVVRDSSLGPGVDDALLEAAMTTILSNLG